MAGIEGPKKDEIVARQVALWRKVDQKLGDSVAAGLGVSDNGADVSSNGKGSHYAPPPAAEKVPHGAR